jgi:hypothetical protein
MEKKENRIKATANKAWGFVKKHKTAFMIGGGTVLIGGIAVALKLQGNSATEESNEILKTIDPNGGMFKLDGPKMDFVHSGDGWVEAWLEFKEGRTASNIGDTIKAFVGQCGVEEDSPVWALVQFQTKPNE